MLTWLKLLVLFLPIRIVLGLFINLNYLLGSLLDSLIVQVLLLWVNTNNLDFIIRGLLSIRVVKDVGTILVPLM